MAARGRPKGAPTPVCLVPNNPLTKTKTPRGWGEQREELFVASNYTTNYQLNQWEAGDQVLRTEFNQDNQKIDTALKTHDDAIAALQTGISKCGTCKFETFSYVGTGTNQTVPLQLSFTTPPLFFVIQGGNGILFAGQASGRATVIVQGMNVYFMESAVTWNGTQVTYGAPSASYQMNEAGFTYWVFAIYMDTDE